MCLGAGLCASGPAWSSAPSAACMPRKATPSESRLEGWLSCSCAPWSYSPGLRASSGRSYNRMAPSSAAAARQAPSGDHWQPFRKFDWGVRSVNCGSARMAGDVLAVGLPAGPSRAPLRHSKSGKPLSRPVSPGLRQGRGSPAKPPLSPAAASPAAGLSTPTWPHRLRSALRRARASESVFLDLPWDYPCKSGVHRSRGPGRPRAPSIL